MADPSEPEPSPKALRYRRLGIDTYRESVVYMHRACPVCRSEGFEAQSRLEVTLGDRTLLATLNVIDSDLLRADELGLSEAAARRLGAREGDALAVRHAPPVASLGHLRAKVHGRRLGDEALRAVVGDIAAGRYSTLELAAFVAAAAGGRLDVGEMVGLTRAMVAVGERLDWGRTPVMDKHCIGGLPGNRTSLLVVPIVAACGLIIPKTSSRAITSPAGTADTMATLAPVALDLAAMRRVVEREGGCIVWGGLMRLSPVDDLLIRVERPLDLDSNGQLVASVLSKKVAAGSTHVVIDIPVGPTAKVRTPGEADALRSQLIEVGAAVGLELRCLLTDGSEPVGRGIGPALEARDVLAVLRGRPGAPADLRDRSLDIAAAVLELAGAAPPGAGRRMAGEVLEDGRAWRKFQAIAEAQGGLSEPPTAGYRHPVLAERDGRVAAIDNRRLARAAKLSGAPGDPAAGLELHAPIGATVERGQPVFTLHAETPGELAYALAYVAAEPEIVRLADAP